jgi:hypothetical protein
MAGRSVDSVGLIFGVIVLVAAAWRGFPSEFVIFGAIVLALAAWQSVRLSRLLRRSSTVPPSALDAGALRVRCGVRVVGGPDVNPTAA